MLIINADDWGGWKTATDAAFACHRHGRITSATAMVFMLDSERAAELAKDCGIDLGLHINFTQPLDGNVPSGRLRLYHDRIRRFLKSSKFAVLLYNPFLRNAFEYVYRVQLDEFIRLYGRPPSHVDGHQHKHLCANMILDTVIPPGEKVRRNFSFSAGEKAWFNRAYRHLVDRLLSRRYRVSDFFFSLLHCIQTDQFSYVKNLAQSSTVEVMTHPEIEAERSYLMSDRFFHFAGDCRKGSYSNL